MRQGDGTDLLGPSDPRSASIGVIYVAPNDDRQSVLTAILTQDKLGFKQVIVVLPDQNKAFQRPVDFDGLKNMRRGLKAEIVFIAPSGPGPAEFARQRRFPVYSSLESFSQSIRLEARASGIVNKSTKRGLFGFGRKQEIAATAAVASASSSRAGEESASSLPVSGTLNATGEDFDAVSENDGSNERNAKAIGMSGLAAGTGLVALTNDQNISPMLEHIDGDTHAQPELDAGSQVKEHTSSNSTLVNGDREPELADSNWSQNQVDPGPGIITFSSTAPRPKITRKFPVPPAEVVSVPIVASEISSQPNGSTATTTNKRSNTGKMAAAGTGVAAVGVGATKAGSSPGGNGGQPPSGSAPGGPGGSGVGGTSRRTRILLAILLGVLTILLIGGITIAALPGGMNNLQHIIPGTTATATVTITPNSKDESNIFQIIGVTSTPNPAMRQVPARIISATSPAQSKTVQSTGSIPGTRATGALTFLNNTTSNKSFGSVILRGASGVPVTFNGPITVPAVPPASLTVRGFAVNVGSAGNIGALDISGPCCATGIVVKNGAFSGGQNPQPNSVVQQSDINSAASALTASLTPGTQAALQKQVHPNEQVVPSTLRCTSAVSANHAAGDHAPNVTVIVSVTCKEEVYDQQAALSMAANLLAKQASTDLGPNYALTGNIVANVTRVTVVDTKGTLSILVSAQGVWVYQFSNTVLQGFANHIANMTNQDAITYLMSQPGVKAVKIDNPNGNTLPDAAHIKFVIVAIPPVTGSPTPGTGTTTVTPGSPTAVPTAAVTPPLTPTPTQGLGGS
jgi:hypothetical protein